MPDEKGVTPGLKGFARGVYSETRSAAQKALALWIVGVLTVMVVLTVAWVRGSRAVQLVMLGSVSTVLVWAIVLGLIGIWRHLSRKPPAPPPAEPKAPQEDVKRLKETLGGCKPAMIYVAEYLRSELCLTSQTGSQGLACELLGQYPLKQYEQDLYVLEAKISAAAESSTTEKEFEEIKSLFFRVLNGHYMTNVSYLLRMGSIAMGSEQFLRCEGLEGLRRRHDELVREIRRTREWPGIAGVANWAQTLADLIPRLPATSSPPPQT